MTELVVESLVVKYGNVLAVNDVSFKIASGEWLTLLGPSGCGKSTTLSAIAGLERPTGGRIAAGDRVFFDGRSRVWLEPEARDLGLVFQSYALWPHMTVEENCAYPLRLRRVPSVQRRQQVMDSLALVDMEPYAKRYPHELSGGQQQRVALARTLVYRPNVLLLDEPLSNLDARLRDRAREWLKDLQRRVGLTTLFVTHDQVEALAMSDRIAVMEQGRIAQLGTPKQIYERPSSRFVADFIGTMSFLKARIQSRGEATLSDGQKVPLRETLNTVVGKEVTVALRPEALTLGQEPGGLSGEIKSSSYLGGRFSHEVMLAGTRIRVESDHEYRPGPVRMNVRPEAVIVFAA